MKFGKVLQQSIELSSSEWEHSWVDYKQLKHIIKDCAHVSKHDKLRKEKLEANKLQNGNNDTIRQSPDELNFFRTVRGELAKITKLFMKEQSRYSVSVGEIEAEFEKLQTDSDANLEKKTKVMASCVALFKEMLLLENFALINYCGISKILKKHDKWTGYNTRSKFVESVLNKQPFAAYSTLLAMINCVEQVFMKATGSTIAQHDNTTDSRMNRAVEVQCGYSMLQLHADTESKPPAIAASAAPSTTSHDGAPLKRPVSLHDLSILRDEGVRFKRTEEETLSPIQSGPSDDDEDDAAYDGCEEDEAPPRAPNRSKRTREDGQDDESDDGASSSAAASGKKKMSFSTILN
ncbi:hypothetical protein H310_07467 [Aphanomyces invadans]|uniref:SPX domain-containing protein n=1 Tax=Aphanomyces invadans TaxID=157072 RepID=A0A024U0T4_9STRA|nr:hypothetical protein H310_07467 [Aphanomyces invadans]ETW00031.1 hypothetical protein H310_07467 [Aphanomyces invadans]|eukprot:XP_008871056.1 hypothetical protein H310_07467 [Aphanomyces invadans]